MKSKGEVILECLAGQRVLDIGGCGYGEDNPYERMLRACWSKAKSRTTVDMTERADLNINLNKLPLQSLGENRWDITTAFDVLEHLEHPVDVLKWIPTEKLLVSLPNALSPISRRMEEAGFNHVYSFTKYTASVMMKHGGWKVDQAYFTLGKWSLAAKVVNLVGSFWPSRGGTGIMLHCTRMQKSSS